MTKQPIATAPRDATEIKLFVQQPDGNFYGHTVGHWAQDLSGEEQPPFRGWFHKLGNSYFEVSPAPTHWEPLT